MGRPHGIRRPRQHTAAQRAAWSAATRKDGAPGNLVDPVLTACHVTQGELAHAIGMGQQQISRLKHLRFVKKPGSSTTATLLKLLARHPHLLQELRDGAP